MTQPAARPDHGRHPVGDAAPGRMQPGLERGIAVCPFLLSRDRAWSSVYASKDLRCWAVDPPVQPATPKQRDLCLVSDHASCATFRAAAAEEPGLRRHADDGVGLWPSSTTVPVALETVHARPGVSIASPRAGGQALLVGLMVIAFVVLVLARTNQLANGGAGSSPSPVASPVASAIVAASQVPSATPSEAPSPTGPAPTAKPAPSVTPAPSASARTYKVRSGDTLASIAAKFHTTVKAIAAANNIVDPRTIHPGQVLAIP